MRIILAETRMNHMKTNVLHCNVLDCCRSCSVPLLCSDIINMIWILSVPTCSCPKKSVTNCNHLFEYLPGDVSRIYYKTNHNLLKYIMLLGSCRGRVRRSPLSWLSRRPSRWWWRRSPGCCTTPAAPSSSTPPGPSPCSGDSASRTR